MKILLILALVMLSSITLATVWPYYQFNQAHTGYTPDSGPATNTSLFTAQAGAVAASALHQPILNDTTMYVASENGTITAFNAITGAFIARSPTLSTAAVALTTPAYYNHSVYVAAVNGTVWRLNSTDLTQVAKSASLGPGGAGNFLRGITVDTVNDRILVPSTGIAASNITALTASTLAFAWSTAYIGAPPAAPIGIAVNSTHLVWSQFGGTVNCTTLAGANVWGSADLGSSPLTPVLLGTSVYVADTAAAGSLYKLNQVTGVTNATSVAWGAVSAVSMATDGTRIYIGWSNASVGAYDVTTLASLWNSTDLGVSAVGLIASGNYVYAVVSNAGPATDVYALNPSTGVVVWTYTNLGTTTAPISSPSLQSGVLYVGAGNGTVGAFADGGPTITLTAPTSTTAVACGSSTLTATVAKNLGAGLSESTTTYSITGGNALSGALTGVTTASIDVSTLTHGSYTFSTTLTDSLARTSTASTTFSMSPCAPPAPASSMTPAQIAAKKAAKEAAEKAAADKAAGVTTDTGSTDTSTQDSAAGQNAAGTGLQMSGTFVWIAIGVLAVLIIGGVVLLRKK